MSRLSHHDHGIIEAVKEVPASSRHSHTIKRVGASRHFGRAEASKHTRWGGVKGGATARKTHRKSYRTFMVNNSPRPSVLKGVQEFYTFSISVVFCTEPYGHHREYVQKLCILSPYSMLCAISVLKHGNVFQ